MNPTSEHDRDIAELTSLLPDPTAHDPGMDPERQALLRSALREEYGRSSTPDTAGSPSRSRRRLTLVLAPTAVACALAVTAGLIYAGGDGDEAPGSDRDQVQEVPPTAAELLTLAAQAAGRATQEPPADDQYVYAEVTGFIHNQVMTDEDSFELERREASSERWSSVDGSRRSLEREEHGDEWYPAVTDPSLSEPTYRLLESLPTDPEVLLEQIYDEAERQYGANSGDPLPPDQGAFEIIGTLLSTGLVPPDTAATLYRAAAMIPGVVTHEDAEDAMGREGVAIAREHDGWSREWIFAGDMSRLLGLRGVVTESGPFGGAGTVYETFAISRVGVVDEPGQVPSTSPGA
ncbi:CU044_5270 family protein [Streptomyces sp. B6B3]|uniref:CU044_5270 family protein n=1 Tax=Streptomyces sp. B6B3 TaxID=3153570 RepID=UPI00325DCF10